MLLLIIPTSLSAANLQISIHYAVQESTILLIQKNIKKEKNNTRKRKINILALIKCILVIVLRNVFIQSMTSHDVFIQSMTGHDVFNNDYCFILGIFHKSMSDTDSLTTARALYLIFKQSMDSFWFLQLPCNL